MTKIKLFATDVDGTMTDACMYYAENGSISGTVWGLNYSVMQE